MDRTIRHELPEELHKSHLSPMWWKRIALAVITMAMAVAFAGCSVEDLVTPFAGDIPFEQELTVPADLGAVDNIPTVPESDDSLGDSNFRPF